MLRYCQNLFLLFFCVGYFSKSSGFFFNDMTFIYFLKMCFQLSVILIFYLTKKKKSLFDNGKCNKNRVNACLIYCWSRWIWPYIFWNLSILFSFILVNRGRGCWIEHKIIYIILIPLWINIINHFTYN